jgi:hypothetical protein
MFMRGRLTLKLPAGRVTALIESGHRRAFDANKGTPMREWFSLGPESPLQWLPLARVHWTSPEVAADPAL